MFGLQNFGFTNTPDIANHQLIFMIELIEGGETIPLSYSATKDAASSEQLVRAIKEHSTVLQKFEFEVVATVCDQGGPNRKAIKQLIADTNADRLRKDHHARLCESIAL